MEKFNFKKKYGQNFLIDKNILEKIINNINVTKDDLIIEIGAGTGNLTKRLSLLNANVIAYEIDLETEKHLNKLSGEKVSFIFGDFLTRDIKSDIKDFNYKNLYIVGNLPYYITTPIIEKIIKENIKPKEMLFMMQKEVAERLSASPGNRNYGFITAYLNYFFEINKLFDVSNNSFMPAPKVMSSVVKFNFSNKYKSEKEEILFQLLKDSFQFKRKTLLNNLKKYDVQLIKRLLEKNNYNLSARAEEISLDVFIEIANAL